MMPRIAVLSPHLDDAVFDCCDHLLQWGSDGSEVTVYTVFCNFQTLSVPYFQREVMRKAGVVDVEELQTTRRMEDIRAMELLNAKWQHWDFVDAGFRSHNGSPLYPDQGSLCSGARHPKDEKLIEELVKSIRNHVVADLVLVPLGVGQHQDHLLVRQAAELAGGIGELRYYLDFPYARNPRRWRFQQFKEVVRRRKSILWMSSRKKTMMNCYASQMPQVFRRPPLFPEVVLR